MCRSVAFFLALVAFTLTAHAALTPAQAAAEYERMKKWAFSAPVAVPAAGITITRDTVTWTLRSGSIRLMEPAADGTVTGFYFEGDGRFRMTIPDRFELAQLRRFSNKPDLDAIDEPMSQLLFRTSDREIAKLLPTATGPWSAFSAATKRHESWLVDLRTDPDARIVAALTGGGESQTIAAMLTEHFDWLTYEYDSQRVEEITLSRYRMRIPEIWISLDRAEDRLADGRPGTRPSASATLTHIDVKADLTRRGDTGTVGRHWQETINGEYVVEETFTGVADEVHALRLDLWGLARDVKAFDAAGAPLTIFRDAVGRRSAMIDNEVSDDDFVVVLSSPLKRGEKQKLRLEYGLETANYAPGGLWYPLVAESLLQKHTARLELTVRKKNEARAMGRMDSRREDEKSETTVWIVERPTMMVTFSTATRFEEVEVKAGTIPTIKAFGPDYQFSNTAKMRNVCADVANSMQWFENVLQDEIEGEPFYVTSIASSHGQAFEGFLHMGEFTWTAEHPGASELFRAHEVAHEWFGHKVAWATYRDQWLSEALAEYASMMFVQSFVKGGDKYFDEILRSYDGIVKGNFAGGFSKFNRPGLIEVNAAHRNRIGPIGHGQRASTDEVPTGYVIQTYVKGPMVVHMLRTLLRLRTNNDDLFLSVLRDYVRELKGRSASTEDFRRILERNSKSRWGWFFDAWVYGAAIPSYTWKYRVEDGEGGAPTLIIDLERRDTADDFLTFIPVRLDFENGKSGLIYLKSDSAKQTVTQKLPSRPKKVVFAPDYSLLAFIRRD